ncbi:hypothetical protein HNR46_004107 [Haloferula luteola]|uniref:Uncharacterized protein n=1 Tax=Haloferula luteola TaxID=595692 RepID=A0A840V7Z4_9BACT|nr:hypothetical protein [Haloferula luteola]MBB5353843.1 hypothetical protein [Haloferula luteola]
MKPRDIIVLLSSLLVTAAVVITILLKAPRKVSTETTVKEPAANESVAEEPVAQEMVLSPEPVAPKVSDDPPTSANLVYTLDQMALEVQDEEPDSGRIRSIHQNGPKKADRVIREGSYYRDVWIVIDRDMDLLATDLLSDPEFHAYAEVSMSDQEAQWIPISVDAYNAKTGLLYIRTIPGGEVTVPHRGMFLLTRVEK